MSGKLAEFDKPPLIPITGTVKFPMSVALLYAAVSVRVVLPMPDVVMDGGEKLAVTPFGIVPTENAILPLNPYNASALTT